jgi:hypothetical protein
LATFLEATSTRALNFYNTVDVTTNFERLSINWTSNEAIISTQNGGTGSARILKLNGNGGAIYFQTGGVDRWSVGPVNNFLASADNSYDIGTSSANRPRSVYAATSITPGRGVTVAGLPTPSTGMIARVTDALTPAIGSTVAGGGAAYALVNYNGANWTVIGV